MDGWMTGTFENPMVNIQNAECMSWAHETWILVCVEWARIIITNSSASFHDKIYVIIIHAHCARMRPHGVYPSGRLFAIAWMRIANMYRECIIHRIGCLRCVHANDDSLLCNGSLRAMWIAFLTFQNILFHNTEWSQYSLPLFTCYTVELRSVE